MAIVPTSLVQFAAELKPNTAYMEVPRCDFCGWWTPDERGDIGVCGLPFECRDTDHAVTIVTARNFGCVLFRGKD